MLKFLASLYVYLCMYVSSYALCITALCTACTGHSSLYREVCNIRIRTTCGKMRTFSLSSLVHFSGYNMGYLEFGYEALKSVVRIVRFFTFK